MLTKKQLQLLEFIHTRLQRDGVPPSFDEMKVALDLRSKSGIHRLITALEERGFIRRLAHRARAIEILRLPESMGGTADKTMDTAGFSPKVIDGGVPDTPKPVPMPTTNGATDVEIMGRIAAGIPIEAISEVAQHVTVPNAMLSAAGQHFALEVKGDSMIEAGINDGDVVVIRETSVANNGDIVVAMVDGYEATLKRYFRKGNTVELEAANAAYPTRSFPEGKVAIQGVLAGLIRTY